MRSPIYEYAIIGIISALFIWIGYISLKAQMKPSERAAYDKTADVNSDDDDVPPTLARVYLTGAFCGLFVGVAWLALYYVEHDDGKSRDR